MRRIPCVVRVGPAMLALLLVPAASAAQEPPSPPVHTLSAGYEYTHLSDGQDPWQEATLEASRRGGAGTFLGRATWARRFDRDGLQGEAEAYPRFGWGYGYLGAGASGSEIFPRVRLGAEAFRSLPGGVELSLGGRWLHFEDTDVGIATGSLARYPGPYYVALRPYVAFRSGGSDPSLSGSLTVRRFIGDRDFVGLVLGGGTAPREELGRAEIDRRRSWRAGVEGNVPSFGPLRVRWRAAWERETLSDDRDRTRLSAGVGLARTF